MWSELVNLDQFIEGMLDRALRRELRAKVQDNEDVTFAQAKETALFWCEDDMGGAQATVAVVHISKDKEVENLAKLGQELKQEVLGQVRTEMKDLVVGLMREVTWASTGSSVAK